ncbi:hypothetical protein ACFVZT_29805 [Streptomyces sp. NPDC058321]|uniref:hypothetical protein n=1 Tax=Streptomyces sp. NPDC058321 TaxID=3346445 RepID=UPI0036F0E480
MCSPGTSPSRAPTLRTARPSSRRCTSTATPASRSCSTAASRRSARRAPPPRAPRTRPTTPGDASTTAVPPFLVKGSGTRYNGQKVDLNLYKGSDGTYQMYDYGFRDAADPYNGPLLQTWDAHGADVSTASGGWPSAATIFKSATPDVGADFTDSGAVDAHWAANKVYAYYKNHFGRKGLDGKDGYMYSLVGVTANGQPYDNAFWDGSKMVYGKGGGDYRTFSAVTVLTLPPATAWANATLPKLYQVAPDGKGGAQRVSCNRGDQVYPAADEGQRVLWLDGTTGYTDLVKRDRPAGSC